MQDTSLLPVAVEIDKSVMFMLATLTNSTLQEVGINLMELADACYQRLCDKGEDGHSTRTKLVYPDTDLVIKLSVKRSTDDARIVADRLTWLENFNTKFKTEYTLRGAGNRLWDNIPYGILDSVGNPQAARAYINKHKWPCQRVDKYEIIKITAIIDDKQKRIFFTKDDLDTYLIENILLREDSDG